MEALNYKEQLMLAAYICDVEKVKQLVGMHEFDYSFFEDIGYYEHPFPLYYFTILAKKVFYDDGYKETVMPLIMQLRHNCEELTEFWKEKFDIDIDNTSIDFRAFSYYFYCTPDGETFLEDFNEFEHIHAKQIDYDLFEAAAHFDYDKVKELLAQGANPDFDFYTPSDIIKQGTKEEWIDSSNIMSRIGDECSFLCSCQVLQLLKSYYNDNKEFRLDERDISDYIGWAAHEEMYRLLEPYEKNN